MALLKFIGAETGSTSEMPIVQTGVSVASVVDGNGGARSFKSDGTPTVNSTYFNNLSVSNTIYGSMRFRIDYGAAPASQREYRLAIHFATGGAANFQVYIVQTTGNALFLNINNNTTNVLSQSVSFSSGSWNTLKYFSTTNSAWVELNGTRYTFTGTMYASSTFTDVNGLSGNVNDNTRPFYVDDVCVFDSNPGYGVPYVIARQFSANSSVSNAFAAVGGANKFSNVSETPFSATNAINSATSGAVQLFVPNSFSSTETGKGNGIITAGSHQVIGGKVVFVGKTSATTSSGGALSMRWRNSSAVNTDYSYSVTTSDAYYDLNKTTSNAGGLFTPASIADLNGSEFGVVHGANTRTQTIEDLWVLVAYRNQKSVIANVGSYALTGTVAGLRKGYVEAAGAGSYAMTGVAAAITKSAPPKVVTADAGSYSVTGATARVAKNETVAATSGSYSISGQVALVKVGKRVAATASSYTLTGAVARVAKNDAVIASAGSYSMTGQASGVMHGWKVAAASSSYTMTGAAAAVTKGSAPKTVTADPGSYSMSGQAATARVNHQLTAVAGSYLISGQAAGLRAARIVAASSGSYALTGQAAAVKVSRKVAAAAGAYTISGTSAGVRRALSALASAGSYALTGQAAAILKARVLIGSTSSYTLTGQPALTIRGRKAAADPGGYLISGTDAALVYTPVSQPGTGAFGFGSGGDAPPVHRQRDARWDGVREAREEARRLFDKVPATPVARRKEAAVRASEAVAKVAKAVQPTRVETAIPLDPALDRLLELQAYLQGLIDQQEAIKAAQAREAAEMWAMIERELAAEQAREEELMVVFSLAL